ncbi:MAG: tRNA-dihydrouridine synthase family protein [Opitutales bacterium]|nr:tRNA-dihydrouridine synthase family protein [Opitutales bacterium]
MPTSQKKFFTALAPMRDITNRQFCDLFTNYGEPDFYVTEFLRVHLTSKIDTNIEDFLLNRQSKNPIFIQLLGHEPNEFVRIAEQLAHLGASGIDLNFGCPMPKICKKGTGGMLLTEPAAIERIVSALKENSRLPISAKIRIGFSDDSNFDEILRILNKYDLFCVTVHARTVRGLYREPVNYEYVKYAKELLNCPVLANGEINSAEQAINVIHSTGCDGVMIGRAAIRNPYIFSQIKSLIQRKPVQQVTFQNIEHYIDHLMQIAENSVHNEQSQVCLMKKYLNFIGQSIDENGEFLYHMRRTSSKSELIQVIKNYISAMGQRLLHDGPYPNLLARPNCE